MSKAKEINVKVFRFNPKKDAKPYYKEYKVPLVKGSSVLNILSYIYENLDSSLAFYYSCHIGKCNGCLVKVNGKVVQACTAIVEGDIVVEPYDRYEVIKDLVVDFSKPREVKK